MTTSLATTQADAALTSLIAWAEQNFDPAVADGVKSIAATVRAALTEQRNRADQMFINAEQTRAYAAELERQRDFASNQLLYAETTARAAHLREIIDDMTRNLGITRADAINFIKTITGENAHVLSGYYNDTTADLAREITWTLRREAAPLSDDTLPALPDDFDPDSEEEL
jgi:hypothetical protein